MAESFTLLSSLFPFSLFFTLIHFSLFFALFALFLPNNPGFVIPLYYWFTDYDTSVTLFI